MFSGKVAVAIRMGHDIEELGVHPIAEGVGAVRGQQSHQHGGWHEPDPEGGSDLQRVPRDLLFCNIPLLSNPRRWVTFPEKKSPGHYPPLPGGRSVTP